MDEEEPPGLARDEGTGGGFTKEWPLEEEEEPLFLASEDEDDDDVPR